MPNKAIILKVALAATVWALIGVAVFDAIGVGTYWGGESRWAMLLSPGIILPVVVASNLIWIGFTIREFRQHRGNYLSAALFSPIIGAALVGLIYWALNRFPQIDVWLVIGAIFYILAFSLLIWPISIGAALSCWAITWNDLNTPRKHGQHKTSHSSPELPESK
ncbi:MAG: hypothetical protein KDN20_11350 [Verrucomicrobiae bacterium]|nr:hypothetical protein [Verrucomicrobiae bacterium]